MGLDPMAGETRRVYRPPMSHHSHVTRLLLVEDHADTAATLIRLLKESGHEVIHAAGVADAAIVAQREMSGTGLDLVLGDLDLPDGSGLEMMREFARRYGLRGIAITGLGTNFDRMESAEAGFTRHLTKPFTIDTLRRAISEMLQPLAQR